MNSTHYQFAAAKSWLSTSAHSKLSNVVLFSRIACVVCAVFLLMMHIAVSGAPAFAAGAAGVGDTIKSEYDLAGTGGGFSATADLPKMIGALIRGIMGLLGVIFLVLTVYAGYKWMLAHGEPGEVKNAQKLLIHSIIGLIITAAAYALTNFVVNAVTSIAF